MFVDIFSCKICSVIARGLLFSFYYLLFTVQHINVAEYNKVDSQKTIFFFLFIHILWPLDTQKKLVIMIGHRFRPAYDQNNANNNRSFIQICAVCI